MLSAGFEPSHLSSSEWVFLSVYLLAVFLCHAVAYKMFIRREIRYQLLHR